MDATSGAPGFAEEEDASAYAARKRTDAFAFVTKAPPRNFEQRWSVWAAGFGGSQTTGGNVIVGSNDTTSRVFGTAVGADYRVSADTLAGFALASGGTNFSVANGLGSGRSDLLQAGAYLRHSNGPAYISAALAYGWQDVTTDRTVTIAGSDRLRAEFNANAWSGRLEGGCDRAIRVEIMRPGSAAAQCQHAVLHRKGFVAAQAKLAAGVGDALGCVAQGERR